MSTKKKQHIFPIMFIIFIILLSVILIMPCIIIPFEGVVEGLKGQRKTDIVCVIARYNEDLSWLDQEPFKQCSFIIYNKGINDNFYKPRNLLQIINLENLGRCDGTYIDHIVTNYNNLHDITVFLPGSCDIDYKLKKAKILIQVIMQSGHAVILARNIPNTQFTFFDFQMDDYQAAHTSNQLLIKSSKLKPAITRPFGRWYHEMFGNLKIHHVAFGGIFSVDKEDIRNRPITFYENLLDQLNQDSNPEVGHYVERSWAAIFHPLNNTEVLAYDAY